MLTCLWRNGDGCGDALKQPENAAPNGNDLVGGPNVLEKCTDQDDNKLGHYSNSLGFTFDLDVQWWNSGYGTSPGGNTAIVTVVRLKNVNCADPPPQDTAIGECPWWLGNNEYDGPYAYKNRNAININNAAQRAALGAPLTKAARWQGTPGSIQGANWRNPWAMSGQEYQSLYSLARLERYWDIWGDNYLKPFITAGWIDPMDANYSMDWGSRWKQGKLEDLTPQEQNVWETAQKECGWSMSARPVPERPAAGDYDTPSGLTGHYYTYAEGHLLQNCRSGIYGASEFKVNGNVVASSKRERYWNGCKNTADDKAVAVNAADGSEQYTVTCTATASQLIIKETGFRQDLGYWKGDGGVLAYTTADFDSTDAACQLPPPSTPICDATGVTSLQATYTPEGSNEKVKTDVIPAGQWAYFTVPKKLGTGANPDSDVTITPPDWYDSLELTADELKKAKTPQLVERDFKTIENNALPERGDNNPGNDPVILQDADNPPADGYSSILNKDFTKTDTSMGQEYDAGIYDTVDKNATNFRIKFLKSTGVKDDETVVPIYGGVDGYKPSKARYRRVQSTPEAEYIGGLPTRYSMTPPSGGQPTPNIPSNLTVSPSGGYGWWMTAPIVAANAEDAEKFLTAIGVSKSEIGDGPGQTLLAKESKDWKYNPSADPYSLKPGGGWDLQVYREPPSLPAFGGRTDTYTSTNLVYGGKPYLVWEDNGQVVWRFSAGSPHAYNWVGGLLSGNPRLSEWSKAEGVYSSSNKWWNLKVWDPYLQVGTETEKNTANGKPLSYTLRVYNGWKAFVPEYVNRFTPGTGTTWGTVKQVAKRDSNGNVIWDQQSFTKCGAGELNISAVKGRGGGSAS